ncbi:MAG TPA: GNAT family N-acetyltransferase [Solirubrobacterales bacterium]|nr:GNAT family N-acetyltransferase [Solirubrobacterales bacterium]
MDEATVATLRREVRAGDGDAIVNLHERLYTTEHGMGSAFVDGVRGTVAAAIERGWPDGGGAWLVDRDGELAGCLALTDEGKGLGRLRWVLLHPDLRGQGLGRRMITEAVARARELGMKRLELDTFGALRSAAAIYRSVGFRLASEEETDMWGPPIAYQHYVLDLTAEI